MEELLTDIIVGEVLTHDKIELLFGENNVKHYGFGFIGEDFLVCRDPDNSEYVWSWILCQATTVGYE